MSGRGSEGWGRGQLAWFRGFSQWIKHQVGVYKTISLWIQLPAKRREYRAGPALEGGRIGAPLSNPAGAECGQREWRREAVGRGGGELCAQPSLPLGGSS